MTMKDKNIYIELNNKLTVYITIIIHIARGTAKSYRLNRDIVVNSVLGFALTRRAVKFKTKKYI